MSLLQNFLLNKWLKEKRFGNLKQKHFGNDKIIYFDMTNGFSLIW